MMDKMEELNKIAIFEGKEVRRIFINDEWYFSVVDVVGVLSESDRPRKYWSDLKSNLIKEGENQLSEKIGQLKLIVSDGKYYLTDIANTETMFRIIQSIPSPKAEPFKRWLAKVGKERLDEIEQPGKAIERAKQYYLAKGYSPQWVQTRITGIETRSHFTEALKESGITENKEYAILTNEIYKSTFDATAQEYKEFKGLEKRDSLRDNMTPLELVATMFSEAASTEIIRKTEAKGFEQDKKAFKKVGK
jgi:DNA-damage-inducible protein D